MILDFDTDLTQGLPPWDFFIQLDGRRHQVRLPTARELMRIMDSRNSTSEAAYQVQVEILTAMTGIPLEQVERFDHEQLRAFFSAVGELVNKRLEFQAANRASHQRKIAASASAAAGLAN